MPDADPETVARAIVLRRLTAAPRSRADLAATLAERDVPDDVAKRVLDRFEELALVDDAAYAEMLVRSRRATRGLARSALARELRQHGIAEQVADAALAGLDPDDELDTARELVQRRLSATRGLDRPARVRRLAAMLARKGYPPGLCLRVVTEVLGAEIDENSV